MKPNPDFLDQLRGLPRDHGLTVNEVTNGCRCSRKTVYRRLDAEQLRRVPSTRGRTLISAGSLLDLLEGKAVSS